MFKFIMPNTHQPIQCQVLNLFLVLWFFSVTLIVKSCNQQFEDQEIRCELNWTIRKLKQQLAEVYPTKPVSLYLKKKIQLLFVWLGCESFIRKCLLFIYFSCFLRDTSEFYSIWVNVWCNSSPLPIVCLFSFY